MRPVALSRSFDGLDRFHWTWRSRPKNSPPFRIDHRRQRPAIARHMSARADSPPVPARAAPKPRPRLCRFGRLLRADLALRNPATAHQPPFLGRCGKPSRGSLTRLPRRAFPREQPFESRVELTRTPTPWYRLPKCFDKLSDIALGHCRVGHLAMSRARSPISHPR